MPAWLLHLALGSQWPLTEGAPGLVGSGAQAALGREPEVGETSCLWQCEATSRHWPAQRDPELGRERTGAQSLEPRTWWGG